MIRTTTLATDPLSTRVLQRGLERPLRYSSWRRTRDWHYGWIDGTVDADVDATKAGTAPWLHRVHAEYSEAISRELQSLEAETAEWVWQLDSHGRKAARLAELLEVARAERADLPETPDEADLSRCGPAERRDPAQVVRARRLREHRQRVLAPADAEVSRLISELDRLQRESAELQARIDVTHDVYVARAQRLRSYYQRRAATYRRGFFRSAVRRQADRAVLSAFAAPDTLIQLPGWARGHEGRGWGGIGLDSDPASTSEEN